MQTRFENRSRDFRQVVQRSPTPADRKRNQIDLASLLIQAQNFPAAANETQKAGNLKQHLGTRSELTKVCYWGGFYPFRTQALHAAKRVLKHTRNALNVATWSERLTKVRKYPDIARFLDLPELDALSRWAPCATFFGSLHFRGGFLKLRAFIELAHLFR